MEGIRTGRVSDPTVGQVAALRRYSACRPPTFWTAARIPRFSTRRRSTPSGRDGERDPQRERPPAGEGEADRTRDSAPVRGPDRRSEPVAPGATPRYHARYGKEEGPAKRDAQRQPHGWHVHSSRRASRRLSHDRHPDRASAHEDDQGDPGAGRRLATGGALPGEPGRVCHLRFGEPDSGGVRRPVARGRGEADGAGGHLRGLRADPPPADRAAALRDDEAFGS